MSIFSLEERAGNTINVSAAKGSPKNKFTFSGVEAPAWQGARGANSRLFNRRATQPCGMDRRMKMSYRDTYNMAINIEVL